MLKKIILVLVLVAMAAIFAVSVFARKAPDLLRAALERTLGKRVLIGQVEYHFPRVFEMQGFEIKEGEPFAGESSFSVDRLRLEVSPLSLSQKKLVIDRVVVENADIMIRLYHGRLYHALSNAVRPGASASSVAEPGKPSAAGPALEIRRLEIRRSNFGLVDLDVDTAGFVTVVDQIDADIRNIRVPFERVKTRYSVKARLLQGRDERKADIAVEGSTVFATRDTDAKITAAGVFIPYFKPYYGQVTSSLIESGTLDGQARVQIRKNDLVLDANLEIIGLLFSSYEAGDQLFGLKADQLLGFLKDVSGGKLKLQFSAEWDLADPNVRAHDVIRRSIEKSIKTSVLGNVGRLLQNVLQKVGDGAVGTGKDTTGGVMKKLKDWVRF